MRSLLLAALLAAPATAAPVCDAVWHDTARNRDIPVRIRLPESSARAEGARVPVILFSHGLGGSIDGGSLWGAAWAGHGLAVVHIQHPGSDTAVYRGAASPEDRRARVRAAATGTQLAARAADAGFVLDEIGRRRTEGACDLARLDPARAGFAGHSMGAWTAQALAGQRWSGAARLSDRRFRAAVALSPSAPGDGSPADAFGGITIPFLSITGTADGVRLGAEPAERDASIADRTGPHAGMPPGQKYLIVFKDGDHMVFSGNRRRRPPIAADSHIQDVTRAATTAFFRATLLGDAKDAAWLTSATGLKARLATGDRFETK